MLQQFLQMISIPELILYMFENYQNNYTTADRFVLSPYLRMGYLTLFLAELHV